MIFGNLKLRKNKVTTRAKNKNINPLDLENIIDENTEVDNILNYFYEQEWQKWRDDRLSFLHPKMNNLDLMITTPELIYFQQAEEKPEKYIIKYKVTWVNDKLWIYNTLIDKFLIGNHAAHGHNSVATDFVNLKPFYFKVTIERLKQALKRIHNLCLHCDRFPAIIRRHLGEILHASKPNLVLHVDYLYIHDGYLLVLVDDFSRKTWLTYSRIPHSEGFIQGILGWAANYGITSHTLLVSDKGSHFTSLVSQKLKKYLGYSHRIRYYYGQRLPFTETIRNIYAYNQGKYEIEKILDIKEIDNDIRLLNKWRGFESEHATWEIYDKIIQELPDQMEVFLNMKNESKLVKKLLTEFQKQKWSLNNTPVNQVVRITEYPQPLQMNEDTTENNLSRYKDWNTTEDHIRTIALDVTERLETKQKKKIMKKAFKAYQIQKKRIVEGTGQASSHLLKEYTNKVSGTERGPKFQPRILLDGDFKDLVMQSTIFSDKSLFIKDIIEDSCNTFLIAMPRRWGKTVNLDMLKRFLEIQVDSKGEPISERESDNYKLFAGGQIDDDIRGKREIFPLNIAKTKLFGVTDSLTIQGTYPVIHADFKNCKAGDYNSVKAKIKYALMECFEEHKYLKSSKALDSEARILIQKYAGSISSKSLSDDEIMYSLQFLSEMLFCHYDKKVWILIDEYDDVANIAYREFDKDNLDKTIKLFSGIYETALEGNPYLEKGVLTGVQFIAQSGMLSGLNNLCKIDFTSAKYAQHYGLDETEFDLFFEHFEVPKKLGDKAKLWYNGYKVKKYCPQNKEVHLKEIVGKYNIWSIASYLGEGEFIKFKSYWEKSGSINFIDVLFANPEVREQMEKLVNGESIYLERKNDFSVSDFEILKNTIGGNKEINSVGLNLLFSYLFIGGYLTIDGKKKDFYELPNMEIKYEMRKKIINYYRDIYSIDSRKVETLIDIVRSIIDTKEYNQNNIRALFKNFYNQFKEMIKGVKLVDDHNNEGVFTNEDVVHSLLNYIVLQTQHSTFGSEIYTSKLDSGKKKVELI
eukprot:augustus_masked-scaffold_9-processed-gene-13.18-mRNA-1 protein AED:1.00 eAED:1.00 QI:0/0/0/0/1/1/3/0/1030